MFCFLKSIKSTFGYYTIILLFGPLLWIIASYIGLLKGVEGIVLNALYTIRGEQDAPIKLIYVDLDSKAIECMGERPFPRIFYAEVVNSLFRYGGAKAIGIDIVFSDAAHSFLTDPKKIELDNATFRSVIQNNKNLVLAAAYIPKVNILTNEETLTEFPFIYRGFTDPEHNALPEQPSINLIGLKGGLMGLINVDESMPLTAVSSWVPMFAKTPGPTYYTLALQLFRLMHDLGPESIVIEKNNILIKTPNGSILRKIPLTYSQLVEVNWFSRFFSKKNPRYSMADILTATAWLQEGQEEEKKRAFRIFSAFEDAVVLIGPVDPMLQDLSASPFDKEPVPRVGIHGNLLKTIASEKYVYRLPLNLQVLLIYGISLVVFFSMVYAKAHTNLLKTASIFLILLYLGFSIWVFKFAHYILPTIAPIGSAVTVSFLVLVYKLFQEEKQKSRIKNLFGAYVSPNLVSQMVESQEEPKLGGMEEDITAFFSDIQNFSTFSEKLSPNQLVELMNEYLSAMTDILQSENGTLDKYIGDAIVSMFGAPVKIKDHALRACIAACRVQNKQIELKEKWRKDKKNWPDIVFNMRTRIGLNSGLATVGNMGSSTRFNYTMMGDTVNIAARNESGAKLYGVYTMVTEATKEAAQKLSNNLVFRFLDQIIVKGRTQSIGVYELLGFKEDVSPPVLECIEIFAAGIKEYKSQNFAKAISLFEKSQEIEAFQPSMPGIYTNPSLLFISRCHSLTKQKLPSDWNGVFTMLDK